MKLLYGIAALSKKKNCDISLDSVTGTYCGKLPSNVETTLTLNVDGIYLLTRKFKEKTERTEQNKRDFPMAGRQHIDAWTSFDW